MCLIRGLTRLENTRGPSPPILPKVVTVAVRKPKKIPSANAASLALARENVRSKGIIPIEPPAECLEAGAKTLNQRDALVARREAEHLRVIDPYASSDMIRGYLLGLYAMSEWHKIRPAA